MARSPSRPGWGGPPPWLGGEVGKHRLELHGSIAFAAWLRVHAALMSGVRNRIEAFVDWGWYYFSKTRGSQVLDRRSDAAHIDWADADDSEGSVRTPSAA